MPTTERRVRPTRPAVIWPVTKRCQFCHKTFSSASAIWVFESYDVTFENGNTIVTPGKKLAVRWCPECFSKNSAGVRAAAG